MDRFARAVKAEDLHPAVISIGHIHLAAVFIKSDALRGIEPAVIRTGFPGTRARVGQAQNEIAPGIHLHNACRIGHPDIPVWIGRYPLRVIEKNGISVDES